MNGINRNLGPGLLALSFLSGALVPAYGTHRELKIIGTIVAYQLSATLSLTEAASAT